MPNTPPHTAMLVTTSLATCGMSCSPDLMPAYFFIFPKVITTLKGRLLHITDIKKNELSSQMWLLFISLRMFCATFRKMQHVCCHLRDNSEGKWKYSSYFICFCSWRPSPRTVLTDLVHQRCVRQVRNK